MDRARPIFEDALHQKVMARIEELIKLASTIWPEHANKFEVPIVRYDIKGRVGGTALTPPMGMGKPVVRFNLIMLYENEQHFIEQTVGHEMAHVFCRRIYGASKTTVDKEGRAVNKKIMPHGREWFEVMQKLGLALEKYHKYQLKSIHSVPREKSEIDKIKQISARIKNIKSNWTKLPKDEQKMLLD